MQIGNSFRGWLVGASLLAANAAWAQDADFTFNVPLDLKAMHPSIRSAGVTCQTFKAPGSYVEANVIARGQRAGDDAILTLDANGNFRGTVQVKARTLPGKSPSAATYYECDLVIDGAAVTGDSRARGPKYDSGPGTARTVRVSGRI